MFQLHLFPTLFTNVSTNIGGTLSLSCNLIRSLVLRYSVPMIFVAVETRHALSLPINPEKKIILKIKGVVVNKY